MDMGPIHIETVTVLKNIKLCMGIRDEMKLENVWEESSTMSGLFWGVFPQAKDCFLTCGLEGDENDEY